MAESNMLLEIENLTIEHRNPFGETVLAPRNVALWVNRGEILALVGERGAGKSAIAQAVAGLIYPGSKKLTGAVRFNGEDLDQVSQARLRKIRRTKIAFLLKDPRAQLNPFISVREHLRESIELAGRKSEFGSESEWSPIFYEVGIVEPEKLLPRLPETLSNEEALRILLATALFTGAELLVMDQATTRIAPAVALQILDVLQQLRAERNLAILMTTDNLFEIEPIADRVIVLFEGGIVEIGSAERIIRQPKNAYTQALVDAVPRIGMGRARLGELSEEALQEGRKAIQKIL